MRASEVQAQLKEHHNDAYGWALSCCGWERTLAEDVLQTSYLKVMDGRAVFAGRSSFKTWLFAVIRRTASEQRRRQTLRRLVSLDSVKTELQSNSNNPVEEVVASENAAQLIAALKVLPRRQREVLHLVFYGGLPIREAAEALGISLGTARTHYERGKGRLREMLAKEGRE